MNADPADLDQDLLADLKKGNDSALDVLIDRWEKPLFAFAWRYLRNGADAQDVVAETFVRLFQNRRRLRAGTRLSAWLFTTLGNLCHNQHRWRMRHPGTSIEAAAEGTTLAECALAVAPSTPDAVLEHDDLLAVLGAALDRLPHDLKTALLLHHFDHLSYREIAGIVGCSERGVETRLYRARQRLRTELRECIDEVAAG